MTEKPIHSQRLPELVPKTGASASSALASRLEYDSNKSSYAGYLFGSSGTLDRPAWSDTARGRLGIRLISRGIVGAAAFTLGDHIANKQMEGYESYRSLKDVKLTEKPLQYVARFWDLTAGRALSSMAFHLTPGSLEEKAHAAWEIGTFRTKAYYRDPKLPTHYRDRWGSLHPLNGRSLGAEIIAVTFNFFSASIGDAVTRNVIQAFDPNVKQPWLVDSQGHATTRDKGKLDLGRWGQSFARASWRIISKNAAEDWAASLPYVYQMKWQRQALAKFFPGFKLSSDYGWNGGVARVATEGPHAGTIVGGYQLPGVIDLQARFVGYNWYTLMYREMYDVIGRNLGRWKDNGYRLHAPKMDASLSDLLSAPGFLARYIVKSFIKANIYMQPAVPFFWIFRTPQSKWKGALVADELATSNDLGQRENAFLTLKPYGKAKGGGATDPAFVESTVSHLFPRARLKHGGEIPPIACFGDGHQLDLSKLKGPYDWGVKRSPLDAILNPFGWLCFTAGRGLTDAVDAIAPHGDIVSRCMHKGLEGEKLLLAREKTLRTFVDASFSYTPYMWAKAETALRVDDRRSADSLGHMDKAIYRMIDNGLTFNFKGAAAAAGDIWHLAMNYNKDVSSREGTGAQSVGDGTVVPRATDRAQPVSKVHVSSIKRVPMHEAGTPEKAGDDGQRQWAESIAGRKLDAQYQPAQPTYH